MNINPPFLVWKKGGKSGESMIMSKVNKDLTLSFVVITNK